MNGRTLNTYFNYLLVLIFLITGTISLYRLSKKADLPFDYNNNLISISKYQDITQYLSIKPGPVSEQINGEISIIEIDGITVETGSQIEFLLDSKNIGESVNISLSDAGKITDSKIKLEGYYHDDQWFIWVTAIIGYIFLLTGLFILSQAASNSHSRALFRILILFGIATLTSPGKYYLNFDIAAYAIRTFHIAGYILGSVSFLHFINIFPDKSSEYKRKSWLTMYWLGLIISAAFSGHVINSMLMPYSIVLIGADRIWDISQSILSLSIIYGIILLIIKYRKLVNVKDKRQIEWLFWGLSLGALPYLLFWVIPSIWGAVIVTEKLLLLLLIFIPISFAQAVVKYQILDISVLIKRSIVYSVLSGIIIGLFYLLAAVTGLFIKSATGSSEFVYFIAAILISILFNPIRVKLQKFVDRAFYRSDYNLRNIITHFNLRIQEAASVLELCRSLRNEINHCAYPTKMGILLRSESGERLKLITHINFNKFNLNAEELKTNDLYDPAVKKDIALIVPITSSKQFTQGFIILGDKISDEKYTNDEVMLIESLASSASIALTKLQFQERMIEGEVKLEKMSELNKMKSDFISSVTHELQTPLTSIKMFAETILDERAIKEEKRTNYLKIITSESDRLSRMINNVLDFSKIERNVKKYYFEEAELIRILDYVINSMQFQLSRSGFQMNVNKKISRLEIYADSDSVAEVFINLISNALKYSANAKRIDITAYEDEDYGIVEIKDYGPGIPEEDQQSIFNTYYRSNNHLSYKIKGMGIGLSIVKHVMDSHKGKVILDSRPGYGCCFKLYFPKLKEKHHEKNLNN